jgi:geranylgeranyl pyrophosphate synthase
MYENYTIAERCRKILEDNGGIIANKARKILFDDPELRDLKRPLGFLSKTWRDPLTPALMGLSCEAVGGEAKETAEAALAMSLINLSFRIWDDIIDKTQLRSFKPTLYGKFGEGITLIIGGLTSAKAFSILSQMNIKKETRQFIISLLWEFLGTMARAENANMRLRSRKNPSSREKFRKIKLEATDLETCLKIGATLGNGSEVDVYHLGRYGLCLGVIMELWKDFHVSLNLTVELAEKIKSNALPFTVIWAKERSARIQIRLGTTISKENEQSYLKEIVEVVLETGALDNTVKTMQTFAEKGKRELKKVERNSATQTLQVLIEAQPQLFTESIPTLLIGR